MKIKIFSEEILDDKTCQKHADKRQAKNKPNEDIEDRVNQFIENKKVTDIKTAAISDALGIGQLVITVLYED